MHLEAKTKLISCTHILDWRQEGNVRACIKARNGTIIMENEKILAGWYEYIGVLYNDNRGDMPVITLESDH